MARGWPAHDRKAAAMSIHDAIIFFGLLVVFLFAGIWLVNRHQAKRGNGNKPDKPRPPALSPSLNWKPIYGTDCTKCGASFVLQWFGSGCVPPAPLAPTIKYANDSKYGERLICTCPPCGYKWTVPTRDKKNV